MLNQLITAARATKLDVEARVNVRKDAKLDYILPIGGETPIIVPALVEDERRQVEVVQKLVEIGKETPLTNQEVIPGVINYLQKATIDPDSGIFVEGVKTVNARVEESWRVLSKDLLTIN
jgi:hypothetical protein